jgi:luciferase-type oxidoreductase
MLELDTKVAGKPFLASLKEHPGYSGVFQPNRLTFGFIAPLEGYPNAPWPTLRNHAEAVRTVDALGFAAFWLRDVPFYDPSFGDAAQVVDPMVYAGWIAAQTSRIAIGTAGIVLPLRDPLAVAKQATSIDRLSGGRFILGLSSGDRPSEYAAFGSDQATRTQRYRDALGVIRAATEQPYPRHTSQFYGVLDGRLDMLPKPTAPRLPIVAVGRAGQTFDWLGENTDGWVWHLSNPGRLPEVIAEWRATSHGAFRPYGYGAMFELLADRDAPVEFGMGGMRGGRIALLEHWKRQRDEGVNHVALNPKPSRRPFVEVAEELAEHILPHFAG